MTLRKTYPFSAIVGQEDLKLVLMLNVVNPRIGGVLIRGEKGTAKSTAVRGLAALLPRMRVVEGCPFSCDPDNMALMCERCLEKAPNLEAGYKQVKVVTLPLNTTEDRVVGGIDFSLALKEGKRAVLPGLLADANRSILYVDEVNLLDDHIVDIILDVAASGENIVEREGISFRHPASFVLVGTMNPEEGDLRPQLLDRFGLCVDVKGEDDVEKRIELIQRREEFDLDPWGFIRRFEKESRKIADQISRAMELVGMVRCPGHLRTFISELCTKNQVAGHRADIVMEQAAKAYAALEGRMKVRTEDIVAVARFVLAHRIRDPQPPSPPRGRSVDMGDPEDMKDHGESQETEEVDNTPGNGDEEGNRDPLPPKEYRDEEQERGDENKKGHRGGGEQVFDVGPSFAVKKIVSPRDRIARRGSGRRSRTIVSLKQGRYIRSVPGNRSGDIAMDATIRAAAPYQISRKRENDLALVLKEEDIREKIRERRVGNFLLFVVDASGSMGARGRMTASKGAIMSLLLDAYQKRDKVAMISFRKNNAFINLPPTSSIELAGKLLSEMPVGGRTPLSAGLLEAQKQVRNYLLRDPAARPIVIIITDGKSNVSIGDKKPVQEALDIAASMASEPGVMYIVVDTEKPDVVTFGLSLRLAEALCAQYFKIEDLEADKLVHIVREKR